MLPDVAVKAPVPRRFRPLAGLGFALTPDGAMERGRVRVESQAAGYRVFTYQVLPQTPNARPKAPWLRRWGWVVVAQGLNWYEMMDHACKAVAAGRVRGRLDDWWHRPAVRK